jgi:hypothetical protein
MSFEPQAVSFEFVSFESRASEFWISGSQV